jgi:O-acetyl-ADP-ribose deacetylase
MSNNTTAAHETPISSTIAGMDSAEHVFGNGKRLRLVIGDITKVPVDAIVNAANSSLRGGSGVDGAIHRAGGPSIMRDLDAIRSSQDGCPTGKAVATTAGILPARLVFHAVGPMYEDGTEGEPEELASCYTECFALAGAHDVKRISFPSISTGIYGYPVREAAGIALGVVWKYLGSGGTPVEEAIFVLFDQRTFEAYSGALAKLEGAK